jgi:hypothetical protein
MSRSALGSAPVHRAGELIVSSGIFLQLLLDRERDPLESIVWDSGATALQRPVEQ